MTSENDFARSFFSLLLSLALPANSKQFIHVTKKAMAKGRCKSTSLTFKHSLPNKNTTRLEGTTVQTVFLTH